MGSIIEAHCRQFFQLQKMLHVVPAQNSVLPEVGVAANRLAQKFNRVESINQPISQSDQSNHHPSTSLLLYRQQLRVSDHTLRDRQMAPAQDRRRRSVNLRGPGLQRRCETKFIGRKPRQTVLWILR